MQTANNHEHLKAGRAGAAAALLASLFFGVSTPFSKMLLGHVTPVMLAALLYLGSWLGLFTISLIRRLRVKEAHEAGLQGRDYFYLLGSIAAGGIGAPILLIYGLSISLGSVASLVLNVEGVFTALVASMIFKEAVGRRIWAAAAFMLAGGAALSYSPAPEGWAFSWGPVLVAGSALMWAIDNNLTRQLAHKDPFVISRIKGLAAGATNLVLALALGEALPAGGSLAGSLALGAVSYGVSLVFFVYALRHLGASRTGTYFGAAPFIGMLASIIVLSEPFTMRLAVASALMLAGLWTIFSEFHEHEHTHESFCHEHRHEHDEHHDHGHEGEGELDSRGPHCHMHEHGVLTHSHAHVPDLHHYHRHG